MRLYSQENLGLLKKRLGFVERVEKQNNVCTLNYNI